MSKVRYALALTCAFTASLFLSPALADEQDPDPADPIDQFNITLQLQSINVSGSINFQNGEAGNDHFTTRVNLQLAHSPDVELNLTEVDVVADFEDGQSIPVSSNSIRNPMHMHHQPPGFGMHRFHHGPAMPQRTESINLTFNEEPTSHRRFSLQGELVFEYPASELEAVIAPVEDFENKRIRIEGLDEPFHMTVNRTGNDNQQIEITYPQAVRPQLAAIRFYDANDNEIRVSGTSSTVRGGQTHHTYRHHVPDGGAVVVQMITDIREIRLPVDFQNLRLPRVGPRQELAVLQLQPIQPREPDNNDNPAAPQPQLPPADLQPAPAPPAQPAPDNPPHNNAPDQNDDQNNDNNEAVIQAEPQQPPPPREAQNVTTE